MLTEESAIGPVETGAGCSWWTLRTVRTVRLALAVTITLAIAQAGNWPLSFLAPVLVAALLAAPISEPGMGEFVKNIVFSVVGLAGGFLFVMLLQPYPLVFVAAYLLAIFLAVYAINQGAPFIPLLMSVVSLLVFPILGNVHEGVTAVIAASVAFSTVLALVVIQLAFGLLPDPADPAGRGKAAPSTFQRAYSAHAARAATLTTIVIAPLMAAFLCINSPSHLLVMIYAGLICLQGNLSHGIYDVKKYLTATAIGGTTALLFQPLILAVPQFYFFVLLSLLVILVLGARRFSDSSSAHYYGSAITAFMILVSSSFGPGTDLDINFIKRAGMILLAGIYVVTVLSIVEPLIRRLWPLEEHSSGAASHG